MNEDDTFRRLKRSTYEEVRAALKLHHAKRNAAIEMIDHITSQAQYETGIYPTCKEIVPRGFNYVLEQHGWTHKEYQETMQTRGSNSNE